MWISWSWPSAVNAEEEGTESRGTISTSDTALRNHPILLLFEKSNVLSKIEVTRLKSKRRLCFSHNDDGSTELERLPEVLWECNDLEKLYLSGNSIKQLPPEVSNLENLTVLSLANNLLESFPEEITFLVQLKWLNLSGNYIPEIPESIQRIRYLEVLWCNNARVNSVDAAIGNCYHLNTLGLRGNEIGLLPNTFSELANLTWITLENNQLKSLPSSMSMLQNLVHLNLQNNCIEVLPDFLYKIRGLKYVFLNSNRIQAVRLIDLYHTNHLNVFDLNHNPFPDEHIIPVLKLFPHVIYLNNQTGNQENPLPNNIDPNAESDTDESGGDWESSVATSDLDSTTDSDCDWHDFDNIPTHLPMVSRFMAMS